MRGPVRSSQEAIRCWAEHLCSASTRGSRHVIGWRGTPGEGPVQGRMHVQYCSPAFSAAAPPATSEAAAAAVEAPLPGSRLDEPPGTSLWGNASWQGAPVAPEHGWQRINPSTSPAGSSANWQHFLTQQHDTHFGQNIRREARSRFPTRAFSWLPPMPCSSHQPRPHFGHRIRPSIASFAGAPPPSDRSISTLPLRGNPFLSRGLAKRAKSTKSAASKSEDEDEAASTTEASVGRGGPADVARERRLAKLAATIKSIEATYGKNSVVRLGAQPALLDVSTISTGSIGLDAALGTGGLPRGRVVEIYGQEATGKTTLALHVIAEAQKQDGICVFIDVENALDKNLAQKIGVQVDDLHVAQPDDGEAALGIADYFVRGGTADVIVIDSVSALTPKAEVEGGMGDAQMAVQARLMSQGLRKLTSSLLSTNSQTLIIFLNQVRQKLTTWGGGVPVEVTSGGNALKYYAAVRLQLKRIGAVKLGEKVVGSTVLAKVTKNKLAPPFLTTEFDIDFGFGISRVGELLDLGIKAKLVEKSGAWFSYGGQHLGQGRENAKQFLRDSKDVAKSLAAELRKVHVAVPLAADEEEDALLSEEDLLQKRGLEASEEGPLPQP